MTDTASSTQSPPPSANGNGALRWRLGLVVALIGWVVYLVGIKPAWFGLETAPGIGLVQTLVFVTGWLLFCMGSIVVGLAFWPPAAELPWRADIGVRLAATGALIVVVAALADVFGFGSHPWPARPSFGPWQRAGMLLGMGVTLLGLLLLWPPDAASDPPQDDTTPDTEAEAGVPGDEGTR